eukprot:TRINITY_DN12683_c0_g1_i1.p1 TRINITY_DN12683_c0_g1~~TRINITY_DN12683_c0_g1_i1.p1  ORF type:complete len:328 (-),score=46.45 TRINITY_DN12683_c0_g1_i1:137-1120(-)
MALGRICSLAFLMSALLAHAGNNQLEGTCRDFAATGQQGPSAFSGSEIRLEEIIDLDKFPIHDLMNTTRAAVVAKCRAELDAVGCCHIPKFFKDEAMQSMLGEATRLMSHARPADASINPYLREDNASLPVDHPLRFFERRTSSFINSDFLEPHSTLRKIYDSDVVVHFFSECLGGFPIYRWADPLARSPYGIMADGDYFPWHFDGNDFTVSVLVQQATRGGDFEYVPDIRTPHSENFDEVRKVLDGQRQRVKVLSLQAGDLQIFKGRYSMHRVTQTTGDQRRIIALPTYVTNPYLVNRPHHSKAFYGRYLPIHVERELDRSDSLND